MKLSAPKQSQITWVWTSDAQPRVAQYREPHEFLLAIIVTWRYQEKPPKNNYEDIKLKSA